MPKPTITKQDRLIDDGVMHTHGVTDELVQTMAALSRARRALLAGLDEVEDARRCIRQSAAEAHNLGAVWTGLRALRLVSPRGRVQVAA